MESVRVSVPPKLKEVIGENEKVHYEWKVNLLKSSVHWLGWFKGLSSAFLGIPLPKVLMLADKDRLDKELNLAWL